MLLWQIFVCNYDRKKIVVDHRQKYVEIANDRVWIEIADERLRFLQTKHLQCRGLESMIFKLATHNCYLPTTETLLTFLLIYNMKKNSELQQIFQNRKPWKNLWGQIITKFWQKFLTKSFKIHLWKKIQFWNFERKISKLR